MVVLGHQGGGSQRLHAGLADGDHVRARPHRLEEPDQVLDIFVEAEAAVPDADIAGIGPVGDVHVVLGQQHAHGVAQQGGEMAADSGATSRTRGCGGAPSLAKRSRVPKGVVEDLLLAHRHDTSLPTLASVMPKAGRRWLSVARLSISQSAPAARQLSRPAAAAPASVCPAAVAHARIGSIRSAAVW